MKYNHDLSNFILYAHHNQAFKSDHINTINSSTTFVTNFDTKDRNKYDRAIELYKMQTGDESLYIKSEAYDINGVCRVSMNSLHVKYRHNLSIFWKILRSL